MKKRFRTAMMTCFALLFLVAIVGCSSQKEDPSTPSETTQTPSGEETQVTDDSTAKGYKMAICVTGMETVFYRDIVADIESRMGPNDTLATFDPASDSAKQITMLEDAIVKGYDLIFTTCIDPIGMRTVFQAAKDKGIPIIVYDFASEDPDLVSTTIVYDDYQLGLLQSEGLAEALGGKGTIIKYFDTSIQGPALRNQAFEDVMAKYPDIEVLAGIEGPPLPEVAGPGIESMLTAHPDVDALWSMASAAGCAGAAVKLSNNNDSLIIGTIGIDNETAEYILDGTMYGCVGQFASDIGGLMWNAAQKVFAGEEDTLEEIYYVDAVWITKDNIGEYWEIK